ncbi:MAG: hypothetical protein KC731_31340, partial [Myxococcales bacterium]|nr:hypothetical protein [Myxococcales bacterium]
SGGAGVGPAGTGGTGVGLGTGAGGGEGGNQGPCGGAQSGILELCECSCDGTASERWYKGISQPDVECSDLEGLPCVPGAELPSFADPGAGGMGGGFTWTGCMITDTAIDCGP